MNRLLNGGLEALTRDLFRMGELAERAITQSFEGFLEGVNVKDAVYNLSETIVKMNLDVEAKAFELIAKYQPVASDLRMIKSYLKIGYDLERYGRYAWDIAFIHNRIVRSRKCDDPLVLLEKLSERVLKMVQTSIRALKIHDAELVMTLKKAEEEVDAIYFEYLDRISETVCAPKCLVTNLLVVRYLERIADHATSIGESIIYIATGEKKILR